MRLYFDQALLRAGVVTQPSDIVQRARCINAFAWIEQRLFEVVGGWASTETDALLKVMFDTESRVHGWNSLLWKDEMPPEGSLRAESSFSSEDQNILVAPGFVTVMDQIESDWQDTGVVSYGHLGVLCKVVLPRLLLTYRLHMAALSPVTDGSFTRAVSIVYDDIMDVWHAANLTLEVGWGYPALPTTPTDPPPPFVSPASPAPAPFSRQINRPYQVPPTNPPDSPATTPLTNPPDSPATAPPTPAPFTEMQLYEYIRWAEMQISGRGQAGHAQAGHAQAGHAQAGHAEYTIGLLLYQHHENPGFGRG